MLRRWTPEEDAQIEEQLKTGAVIGAVLVAGRKKSDIRKRAYRIGLLEKHLPTIQRRARQWRAVKDCLEAGGKTLNQMAALTGLTKEVIRGVLNRNRNNVHISGRKVESPLGRRHAHVWSLGAGKDEPEFDVDDTMAAALFEARRDPEAAMIAEARERLRETEARGALIRRDPYVTALFGQYCPQRQATLAAGS